MPAPTDELWQAAEMVISILFVIAAVLAIGQFLLFGALAEAYRDIRQLREFSGMIDQPTPVELGSARDQAPSSLGLCADLDSAVRAVVVFLEGRCGTCRMIASSLNGGVPSGMWLVVVADSPAAAFGWLGEAGFEQGAASARQVMVLSADEVERHFGAGITPLAIDIEHGRLTRARTVPSVRQFYAMVPSTLALSPPQQQGALA